MTGADPGPVSDIDVATVREIERFAAASWPAEQQIAVGPWVCRRTPSSSTQRANSFLALDALPGDFDAEAAIDEAIAVCDATGGIPRFQVSPASRPADLDRRLGARGFRHGSPTAVMAFGIGSGVAGAVDAVAADISEMPEPRWFQGFQRANPLPGEAEGRLAIIDRARSRGARVACAGQDDETGALAALGIAVGIGDAAMILGMHTFAPCRRRGYGTRVLRGLVEWALEIGHPKVYLQVETDNLDAIGVYRRSGFRDLYAYHYRTLIRPNKVG